MIQTTTVNSDKFYYQFPFLTWKRDRFAGCEPVWTSLPRSIKACIRKCLHKTSSCTQKKNINEHLWLNTGRLSRAGGGGGSLSHTCSWQCVWAERQILIYCVMQKLVIVMQMLELNQTKVNKVEHHTQLWHISFGFRRTTSEAILALILKKILCKA